MKKEMENRKGKGQQRKKRGGKRRAKKEKDNED